MSKDKVMLHKEICERMTKLYEMKNHDYGDSFVKLRAEYPESICYRLTDKLNRLKALYGTGEQKVKDETVSDTLLDIANYCIMEIIEIERVSEKSIPFNERS